MSARPNQRLLPRQPQSPREFAMLRNWQASAGRSMTLAAALWLLAAPLPASAFSQIGSQDGSDQQKDGIVSVPLPPLPGASEPAVPATPPTAPASKAPASPTTPTGTAAETPAAAPPDAAPAAPTVPSTSPAAPSTPSTAVPSTSSTAVPLTAPAAPDAGSVDDGEAPADTGDDSEDGDGAADPSAAVSGEAATAAANTPPAEIFYGDEGLPPAVVDLRRKLIEICRAGDIEALRPYLQGGEDATVLTFGGTEGDPITLLKSASGDGEGVEMLAILLEVLQAGHVRSEPDTDSEIFVWPYFTGVPIDKLTNPQKVELFELVTAGDYQEMLGFGAYNFYRVGITPDGKLQFFVAGD